ncbi:MAG: hypothetical protein ACRDTH_25645 [Pseudonocardiaceae bacterium]
MTARRRRKLGSGPSATALIAWVGGAQTATGTPPGTAVSGVHAWSSSRLPGGRAIFVGRALGLAAGTVLACGSVLASAVNVGDGSLTREGAALPSHTPAGPAAVSGTPDGYGATASAERVPAAPVAVSAQAFARTSSASPARPVRVHRNTPVSVDVPAEQSPAPDTAQQPPWRSSAPPADHAPAGPIAPVSPVLDPAASGVGRVAPVDGVLEPAARRDERPAPSSLQAAVVATQAVAPLVEEATQPAMTMLGGLLPTV